MNIWILTIGSSDVQLKTKANWTPLCRKVRDQLDNRGFTPGDKQEDRHRVQSRVLGVVYSQAEAEQNFNDLVFPLVDNFIAKIKEKSIKIDRIILILSDQSIFDVSDRATQRHPYWEDTCTLQPLLEKYLKQELEDVLPDLQFQNPPLILKAKSKAEGLDNWNSVLDLVKEGFGSIQSDSGKVYVSHQAGTPAISSAVQFCSLAKFGDRVRFLVSNEHNAELTGFVESSSYLRGIKREQAKELLKNYDYAGVEKLIGQYLSDDDKILMESALQWNFAKFDSDDCEKSNSFACELLKLSSPELQELKQAVSDRRQYYWWTAYEAAYLGIVRLEQKNTVEAMFHTFRSIEGLIRDWAIIKKYPEQIKYSNPDQPNTPYFHPINLPPKLQEWFNRNKNKKFNTVALHGKPLFELLKESESSKKIVKNADISEILCGGILVERNTIFHQLKGLDQDQLYRAWGFSNLADSAKWESRVLGCLNFIVNIDLPDNFKNFKSPKDVSLMAIVHQELEKAIDNL